MDRRVAKLAPKPFLGWVVDNDFEGLAPLRLLSREREGPLWEDAPFEFPVQRPKGEPDTPPLIKVRVNDFGNVPEDVAPMMMPGYPSLEVLESLRAAMPGVSEVPAPFYHQPRERLRRSSGDYAPGTSITAYNQLGMNVEGVLFINLKLGPNDLSSKLWTQLQRYLTLRVLILAGCGIVKLADELDMPLLRLLDLSANLLNKESSILKFVRKMPGLQEIDLRGNPLKDVTDLVEKLVGTQPCLEMVNGAPVELEHRVAAVEAHSKRGKAFSSTVRWDWTVCSITGVVDRQNWEPANIRKLILPNMQLTMVHLRDFCNVELLDLSGNSLSLLLDCGIGHCMNLRVCDLRSNAVAKKEQLGVFQFCTELRQLLISNNEVCKLKDYRSFIIWSTRLLRGSNRSTGLLELDGVPVTLEERMAAIALHTTGSSSTSGRLFSPDADITRWYLTVFEYYGRAQLAAAASLAKYCVLPDRKFANAEVGFLSGIRVMDLSGNALSSISGLSSLEHLLFLDLSNNPKLPLNGVLSQLSCTTLQQISLYVDVEVQRGHARNDPTKAAYRNVVLDALLMRNPKLNYLDEVLVSPTERVETMGRVNPNVTEVERYRFQLACALPTLKQPRVLHPSALDRCPYNCGAVVSLLTLHDSNLSVQVDFSAFVSLRQLNLRGNKLTDLLALGLQSITTLCKLDVSFNSIRTPIAAVATFLDGLPQLSVVALRNNPSFKSAEDRRKLIGAMASMKREAPVLTVIDTTITIRERIEALQAYGGLSSGGACEELRSKAIMISRVGRVTSFDQITKLDFCFTGLKGVDLGRFISLRVLLLRGNGLHTLGSIQHLESHAVLEVFDVRDNGLTSVKEVVAFMERALMLESAGLSGNKLPKDYRVLVLTSLRRIHFQRTPFRCLDEEEITPAEIFAAAQSAPGVSKMVQSVQQMRFDVAFARRSPDVASRMHITQLNLSNSGLESVDLASFTSLMKLSLADNLLTCKALQTVSSISRLRSLTYLDLARNKIKSVDLIASMLSPIAGLVYLDVSGNPGTSSMTRVDIARRFDRLMNPASPFRFLNGTEMNVSERCEVAQSLGAADLDSFRLSFCLIQREATPAITTSLDLSKCALVSLSGLNQFSLLVSLDLSHNFVSRVSFSNFPSLRYLDVRFNAITGTLAEVTEQLRACSALSVLFLLRSLADGSTNKRNEYLAGVFEALPQLLRLDGHKPLSSGGKATTSLRSADVSYLQPSVEEKRAARASQTGLSVELPSGSRRTKRASQSRKVRTNVDPRKVQSAASSPVVPRLPALSEGFSSAADRLDHSGSDSAEPELSPSGRSTKVHSPHHQAVKNSPGRLLVRTSGKSPGRRSQDSKSPGRREDSVSLSGSSSPTFSSRSVSTGGRSVPELSPVPVGDGSSSRDSPASKRRSIRRERTGSSGSHRKRSERLSRSASQEKMDAADVVSSPPSSAANDALSARIMQMAEAHLERSQAQRNAMSFSVPEPLKARTDSSEEQSVQAIQNAADLLRSLDFGSSSRTGSAGGGNSDDEYAESDEAEWRDLSDDGEEPQLSSRANVPMVDPQKLLLELQMFDVGPVELEEEDQQEHEDGGRHGVVDANGALMDKFDLATHRGSRNGSFYGLEKETEGYDTARLRESLKNP